MARYDFWTHGVNTFIEFPDRPMYVIQAGWGTKVRQIYKPHWNENNWFHLPIPTPTVIKNDTKVNLVYVWVYAETNELAKISEIHVREYNNILYGADVSNDSSWSGPDIKKRIRIGGTKPSPGIASGQRQVRVRRGLAVCIRVEFLGAVEPYGEIVFHSVGARFDE